MCAYWDTSRAVRRDIYDKTEELYKALSGSLDANAKKLLPEGAAVAVITNDYHLARARRLLAHAGLGDAGVPAKTPYPGQWAAVRCREYCSIMGLMLTGRW